MRLSDSRMASTPPATTCHCPGVETRSLSKKRRKKWRRSSKPVECVSSSQPRSGFTASSAPYRGEDTTHDAGRIFLLGQLREDGFERRLSHQVAQTLDGVVR